MRVFKTRYFDRWSKGERLSVGDLQKSVKELEDGLVEADLGGYLYKKRIAIPGKGKRGGFILIGNEFAVLKFSSRCV